jgi:hypothetical protein
VFEYFDISEEPWGGRPVFDASLVERLKALGFAESGWVAAVLVSTLPKSKSSSSNDAESGSDATNESSTRGPSILTSQTMVHEDGTTMLALSKMDPDIDQIALKTLFSDGSIVSTEIAPPGPVGRRLSRKVQVAARHRYDLATVQTSDPEVIVQAHWARVRTAQNAAPDRHPVRGSLVAYLAVRQRYREIADPRQASRTKWTRRFGWLAFLVMTPAVFAALVALGASGVPLLGCAVVALLFGGVCGEGASFLSLHWGAQFLIRDAVAPPPRAAESMIEAQAKRAERTVGRFSSIARAADRAREAEDTKVGANGRAVTPARMAELRGKDVWLRVVNAADLVVVGFLLMPVLGNAGPVVALGIRAVVQGAIVFATNQQRIDALRRWLLPEAARAFGTTHRRAPRPSRFLFVLIGAMLLAIAYRMTTVGGGELARWLPLAWGCLGTVLCQYASKDDDIQ